MFRRTLLLFVPILLFGCSVPESDGVPKEPSVTISSSSPSATIRLSIHQGGEWFLSDSDEKEFLHYGYLPKKGRFMSDNNDLRKMGALWSITGLYHFTGDRRYGDLATKGMEYFKKYIRHVPQEDVSYVDINGKTKLGYSAFAILGLLGLPEYPNREDLLRTLANGIITHQNPDGSYRTYLYSDRTGGEDFYPGEANLALMEYYEATGDPRALLAVKRSFPYYREHWKKKKTLAFVPWQTQAFVRLYRTTEYPGYRDFVFQMTDWLISYQQTSQNFGREDYIGGFKSTPGISTSSYLEGLVDAYALAVEVGDLERSERYGKAVELAAWFIVSLQFREDNTFGYTLSDRIRGGFRQSRNNASLRVDNNQHAVMALMKVYRLL